MQWDNAEPMYYMYLNQQSKPLCKALVYFDIQQANHPSSG